MWQIYWAGPLGGAVMAGVLHHFIFDPSKHRLQAKIPERTETLLRDKDPLSKCILHASDYVAYVDEYIITVHDFKVRYEIMTKGAL